MLKNFRLNILFRILFIALLIGFMLYFIFVSRHYLRSVYLFIFLVILIIEFIWYVDRTNRDFTSFLLALLQNDFTTTFSESNKGRSFNNLYRVFNQITQRFKRISTEKQAQHIYLETLVEHVKVGIISFDENGKIYLMNEGVKQLLDTSTVLYIKSLSSIDPEMVRTLREIKPGERKLLKVNINNNLLQLSIHASEFKQQEKHFKLVSIQNIKNELEFNELDAWQKLIRVLTHEIMNSVTPISSLTDTLRQIAETEIKKEVPNPDTLSRLLEGLNAIKSRSAGLQTFTEAYRSLTKIPTPSFEKINVRQFLKKIETLLSQVLDKIQYHVYLSEKDVFLIADPQLLDQVFINLIKNAVEAMENAQNPSLNISVTQVGDKTEIRVTDNGPGIDQEKIDKIFVPFFTTKEKGSGIGLAFSRQIMRLHNGSINVKSSPGNGTTFILNI